MTTYELDKPDNLVEMLENSLKKFGNQNFLGTKNASGKYDWITYYEFGKRIDNLRAGLASLGVKAGDSVGVIANNCVEWGVACYATHGLCAKYVPMYEAELKQIWKYIITDSETKVLFVSKKSIYDQVKEWIDEIKTLEHVILIEGSGPGSMKELESIGEKSPIKAVFPKHSDIAALIYTSGTTGNPKGVLLSHGNLTSNVHALYKIYNFLGVGTITLSFLPWAHSFGQMCELHFLMFCGAATGFAESPQTIVDDLQKVRPTVLIAVPRIFNRVYDRLWETMNEAGGIKKALFEMGVNSGKRRRELAKKGKKDFLTEIQFTIARKIVFSKILERFGGRLNFAISSSAALSPHIAEFFQDVGLPVYEAWGMTELSPAAATNVPGDSKVGSVGKAIDKVKIVLDKSVVEENSRDGEIIVYGPNVMQGYHNKPDQTKEVMTEDGGIRTGDRGYIDEEGFLFITGRIKEQFKLENGKFVFPASMEEDIKLVPYIEHAMIYGLNRPYTVCLVVPDFPVLEKYCKEHKLSTDRKEMANHPQIKKLIEDAIHKELSGKFGSYEIPKKILILEEPFSVENKMLTQTLKLKRREVLSKYQEKIDQLYSTN